MTARPFLCSRGSLFTIVRADSARQAKATASRAFARGRIRDDDPTKVTARRLTSAERERWELLLGQDLSGARR